VALDRDDLAARCLVALLPDVEYGSEPVEAANAAVDLADALLARLASSAPVAAASRAAYVPKVGDVVRWRDQTYPEQEFVVVRSDDDRGGGFAISTIRNDELPNTHFNNGPDVIYIRPATPTERAAAGLDAPPAPPVDREGLADALRRSRAAPDACEWTALDVFIQEQFREYADAAIAFLRGAK